MDATTAVQAPANESVVLLPLADGGTSGMVVVNRDDRQIILAESYDAVRFAAGATKACASNSVEVESIFGTAIAAVPSRPVTFLLYYTSGSDELTPESKEVLEKVLTTVSGRPVPDVVVLGYTDTVGSDLFNDALSRQRAESMRAILIRSGISPENIVAVGRGKRDPLVPTGDDVPEPRNRRVEIVVR